MCKYIVTITVKDNLYQSENDSLICIKCKPSEIEQKARNVAKKWIHNSHFAGVGNQHAYTDANNYRLVWVQCIEPLSDDYYAVMSTYLPVYDNDADDGSLV